MNNIKNSMYIIFISLLILNMLLIFFGVYTYFFDVKDYTLVAGIIAFFGAVIGGSITLIGVNKTIIEARRKESLSQIPQLIKLLNKEHQYILDFQIELMKKDNEDKTSLKTFLFNINSELNDRMSNNELLVMGKDMYNLYKKIIKQTSDLYIHLEGVKVKNFEPTITNTQ
ncbi:hypothetical protein [Solibacillus sp. CAU 1738]|uniref:hypothetical protein n=1 Tax=Solibacillus sp. CAU 1738 TaxID=3140363 RepID=UPI00326087D7